MNDLIAPIYSKYFVVLVRRLFLYFLNKIKKPLMKKNCPTMCNIYPIQAYVSSIFFKINIFLHSKFHGLV